MLRVEGLAKSYGEQSLFEGLSFQLTKGERCSLVGRNGSGKSTLLRILMGDETPDAGVIEIPKSYHIGYLEQNISFTEKTLRQEAALALPKEERTTPYRVEAILSGLGFKVEDLDCNPKSFSGGYQLRIQLAKTLAGEPDCLLLDEPTNYLDIVSIRWLEKFLSSWNGEMIVISHDRSFLDAVSTHTIGLHRKKLIRVEGKTHSYYDHIIQMEESHEKTRIKIEKKKEHAEDFIRRFGAKATKAKQAQSRRKAIDRLPSLEKLAEIDGLNFQFNNAPFSGRRMLQVENLEFKFPNMKEPLISNVSFEIEPGDRIAIIGKNGRGKSTILRLLTGELKPDSGTVTYSENLSIGFFGQTNIQKLNLSLSVEEEIQQADPNLPYSEVRKICGMMMFSGKQAEKKIRVLSGGEKSRVLLGRILASSCNLLLLDEPTNHLDLESIEALTEALEVFPGSVVIVSHGEELLKRIPDKLIICHQGEQQFFPSDYQYFLEKIGWEESIEKKKKEKKDTKKEIKKKRAEVVKERSRVLAPIKKEIERLEKEITESEKKISTLQSELEAAIEKQDNASVSKFSKEIGETQKVCDALYHQLDALYEKFEAQTITFDQSLEAIEN